MTGNRLLNLHLFFQVHVTPFLSSSPEVVVFMLMVGAVPILRCKKNMMTTDYYIAVYLRKYYAQSYPSLAHRWKDYTQRKYDIIGKVQKDGLLLVGINPSFDESFKGPCEGEVRDSENEGISIHI